MVARTRSFALLLLGGTIPLVACLEPTVVGRTDAADDETSDETYGTIGAAIASTGAGVGYGAAALATWNDRFVEECPGCPSDLLWLVFDTDGTSCDAPLDVQTGGPGWRVALGLPPSRVAIGTYLISEHPDIVSKLVETESGDGGVTGGAVSPSCVLDILELGDASLRVALSGCTNDFENDATYEVPRCEPTTLPPEAIARADLGEGGGAPAPDGVVVVVGDALAACGDPLETGCAGEAFQLAITLPSGSPTVGTYDLEDLEVSDCGLAAVLAGTISVLAVDDATMVVRLASSDVPAAVRDQELRVMRCP